MQILIWFLAGALASALVAWLIGRGRSEEVEKAVSDARDRENSATAKAEALAAELRVLDREKTQALKDAEAANKRAEEMIAQEREAQQRILRAKDEQIEKLNEFIAQAKEAMTTEFKAVSGGVLKDAREQLTKRAEEIITQHGEKTTGDVALHKQQIAKMLGPVEQTIIRLEIGREQC